MVERGGEAGGRPSTADLSVKDSLSQASAPTGAGGLLFGGKDGDGGNMWHGAFSNDLESPPVSEPHSDGINQDRRTDTLKYDLNMAKHLLEKEIQRTQQVQHEIAAAEARAAEARDDLQKRLEKAIKKATEQGLDVRLGLNTSEDFSENANFKMGAKLREKESLLAEIRGLVSSLHKELARREAEYTKLFDPKRRESEERLTRCQQKVGSEEAKNAQLSDKLADSKEVLRSFRAEARAAREAILERLVNNEEERDKYSHVCIAELVRLMLQERDTAYFVSRENKPGVANHRGCKDSSSRSVKHLMQELEQLRERNGKLRMNLSGLEAELRDVKKGGNQVKQLKDRVVSLLSKQMKEKNIRFQLGKTTEGVEKKVIVLSDHVERLMLHLKHEIVDKAQAHTIQGRALSEIDLLRARNDTIAKKNLRKDRVIVELQEGERILEDQLRLLDDKYAELRSKLNVTRQSYRREVKRYVDEAQALRLRWEKETRGALPLELVPLPYNHRGSPHRDRKAHSAPLRRRSNSTGTIDQQPHQQQPRGRAVVSEGGAKIIERLEFSEVSAPPVPCIPPPEINLSLPDMHLGGTAEPHEPWSDQKVAGLQQALDERRRKSVTTPNTTTVTTNP